MKGKKTHIDNTGKTPWNKNKKVPQQSGNNHWTYGKKRPEITGENHYAYGKKRLNISGENHWAWKGDQVGYDALHVWVAKHKERTKICIFCKSSSYVEWANRSHEYKRDLDDWIELCRKCHRKYDKNFIGAKGSAFS